MKVRLVILGMVVSALVVGALLYYTQVYAYYETVDAPDFGEVELTSTFSGQPEGIMTEGFEAIDSFSSPIRFRACFSTPVSMGTLTDTYEIYEDAVPLNGPVWFDCYDAKAIGHALETGEAVAFLGQKNIQYGIDRVVAVMPDGEGYVWHQINPCGEAQFNGDPLPEACPEPEDAPAEGTN